MTDRDTIYATSSGPPPAAIAIVRVSGPRAFAVGETLAGNLPAARRAVLRALRDPRDSSLLDRALVLVFPAPRTATGEDVIEFHVHGGRAVVAAVEALIGGIPDTRRAEPGEFTRRALENGVIDLTAAEGLGDLLSAQTETQRRAALRMAEGGVRTLVEDWSSRLVHIAARVEAQLDFSDEGDVAVEEIAVIHADVAGVLEQISATLVRPPVERLHDGLRVVIAGPPNSGKSTLLNTLVGRDVAIVSAISGTTRDRIEAPVLRAGVAYLVTDTAGLTETPGDAIEAIGVDRARAALEMADIVLWLGDTAPHDTSYIAVHARADVPGRAVPPPHSDVTVSAATGVGIDALWSKIERKALSLLPTDDAVAVNARQREALARCHATLTATQAQDGDLLVVAEELRAALLALHEISGRAGIEDVLDAVFSRFCIGK